MAETPNQVFADLLREGRKRKGWTQQDLADRMEELGWPIDRATIARTEAGAEKRRVTLDEFVALCAALGVAPVHMFVQRSEGERLALAPSWEVSSTNARRWARGELSLRLEDSRSYYTEVPDDRLERAFEQLRRITEED